jgi:predicted DNA-binding transcriptional regulator YafY
MASTAILRRYLRLIRWTRPPYSYPSKKRLAERLQEEGIPTASTRTIERDLREIREEYGIHIKREPSKGGYYLFLPPDEDVHDFEVFLSLLERHERMSFLQGTPANIHDIGRYLQLEHNEQFVGSGLLPTLWEALQGKCIVHFDYASYDNPAATPEKRAVEPGILFEYKNRWYLDGWDVNRKGIRTFGLDRMAHLVLSEQTPRKNRYDLYAQMRRHVIGVTCPPDAIPIRVVLRFTAKEAQFVRSLPLHSSQKELATAPLGWVDFELWVILNHELEREILAFGELVEVQEPEELREKIRQRLIASASRYQP